MSNGWWIFAAFFAIAPSAGAEIFKCKDARNNIKYQNFPCIIDSIGSRAVASPPEIDDSKPDHTAAASQQNVLATSADLLPDMDYDEPRTGMTGDQVRRAWGDPTHIENSAGMEGLSEIWHYDNTRRVHFDNKSRVFAVEQ
jgi:hypothetical protein